MFTKRSRNSSNKRNSENNNNNSEDEQIKNLIKEINNSYKNTLFFDIRKSNKLRTLIRNRSNFDSVYLKSNNKKDFQRENSLTFQLKNKINKESLILELREELKYHIKFNFIYKRLLSRAIQLKEAVKENKEQIELNTNALKETFKDRFDIIDNYEKTIKLLDIEKKELITSSTEILKMRENTNKTLMKQFSEIQERNNEQRKKIDNLSKNISLLEYKKSHVNDELETKLTFDASNYEKHLRLYKALKRKYEYLIEEYNTFIKSGNEITKIDVKLFDNTNAKNFLIEENLDIALNEQKIRKQNLLDNISDLKIKIKYLKEKQEEEKLKEEKKKYFCKYNGLYRTTKFKYNPTVRKSSSYKTFKKKIKFE